MGEVDLYLPYRVVSVDAAPTLTVSAYRELGAEHDVRATPARTL